jgi:hypothetical protein
MNSRTTLNYYGKIRSLLTPNKFNFVKNTIGKSSNEELEAFYNIIIAGYPIDFAVSNYMKLYEYLRGKPINYSEALDTYVTYPGLEPGIHLTKTKWYELN